MSEREFIPRSPAVQPTKTGTSEVSARDFTTLSRKMQEISEHISADTRPHLSSRFIDSDREGLPVTLTTGQINGVVHGLGRKYRGWHLAGKTAAGDVYELTGAEIKANNIDTTVYLPLRFENGSAATVDVRIVVW